MIGNGKILLFAFAAIISLTAAQNWWETGKSVDITIQNFEEYVGKDKHVIVDVYAQFCFYCRMMQPEWDKLAEHYMGENPPRRDILVAKMDGGNEPDLANRYGVNGFPSFMLFKKGDIFPSSRYNGERTSEQFSKWVESVVGPEEIIPVDEVKDPALVELLDEMQKIETQDQDEANRDASGAQARNGNLENVDVIVQKLDFLADIVNNQNGHRASGDLGEIKTLISDLDNKLSKKGSIVEEEINFSHGTIFMLLGVVLGIGISFGITNYQKLTRSRKLLD
jgi:thioredoxin-like negative regulator of GroEL